VKTVDMKNVYRKFAANHKIVAESICSDSKTFY
jgi:hypothetical protein